MDTLTDFRRCPDRMATDAVIYSFKGSANFIFIPAFYPFWYPCCSSCPPQTHLRHPNPCPASTHTIWIRSRLNRTCWTTEICTYPITNTLRFKTTPSPPTNDTLPLIYGYYNYPAPSITHAQASCKVEIIPYLSRTSQSIRTISDFSLSRLTKEAQSNITTTTAAKTRAVSSLD